MILLLDTSTPVCRLVLVDADDRHEAEWEAGRGLAKGLLGYLEAELAGYSKTFSDITGIGVFRGPGSFTGLRIGAAVLNTVADALNIPIVGASEDDWQTVAIARLRNGESDQVVLPFYGSDANITPPRK
jgi:tRNA threonylcarbamoyladenosine biosynthesis protein TsaB